MIEAQPSGTAYRVALRRAAHQLHDALPLVFTDPFAVRLLGPEASADLAHVPPAASRPYSAAMRAWVVARARFAEDVLAATAAEMTLLTEKAAATDGHLTRKHESGAPDGAGVQNTSFRLQYLVLGAGLDTFALRNPYPHVRVFEVDHPATQAWKRQRLAAANLEVPANAQFVPVDFERQDLAQELHAAGFDPGLRTITAWLGVVPYLTAEAFHATVNLLGGLAPHSAAIFDYGQPREALSPEEQLQRDSLAARVAEAGEPFRSFFTPATLQHELAAAGLQVIQDLGSAALNELYFSHRLDELKLRGSAGRLCHAAVP